MNLENSRVVIVDDQRRDVEKLMRLLHREGIPFNYYFEEARSENLPRRQLKNVRLVFLDFVLGTDGQPVRTKMATLLNVLGKILHHDNGPYVILAWTTHNRPDITDDLIGPFKTEILANTSLPKPVAIIDLDKISVMRSAGSIDRKLREAFGGKDVFEVLLGWEHQGQSALATVLKTLTDMAVQNVDPALTSFDQYSSDLKKAVEKNMFQLADSVAGKHVRAGRSILVDAQLPLSGIFQDHLESSIRKQTPDLLRLSGQIYRSRKNSIYKPPEKAQMNTCFLLMSELLEASVRPGNIYKASAVSRKIHPDNKITFSKADFYKKRKLTARKTDQNVNARVKELNQKIIPILLEMTPECDYVQNNWKHAKFAFGVLWPHKFIDGAGTEDYLNDSSQKLFPKLLINFRDHIYYLTFHSDYQITLRLSALDDVKPILRARKEMLADIQHWYAMHASRPGKTEFK